ncbi:MAG: FmdB family zinc ribbon protein [Candidatus Acidiferrales bacterium]
MPIFEYVCDDCGERYEKLVMTKSTKISCPKCESSKQSVQLSVFAAPANGTKASNGGSSASSGGGCCGGACGCRN